MTIAARNAAASLRSGNRAFVEDSVERVREQRILDLTGDAASGGHGFAVVKVGVRRTVDEEIRTRHDARRNLHDVELRVGRDDRLDAERAEEALRSADFLAYPDDVL